MGDLTSLEPILVTGCTGFLGGAVVRRLTGLAVLETSKQACDLRDWSAVEHLFFVHKPKAVINCAALCGGL